MSEFVVGARVAILSGFAKDCANPVESTVTKVHKNGNFLVEGKGNQHKTRSGGVVKSAYPTGQEDRPRYTHVIYLWDAAFDERVSKDRYLRNKETRLSVVRAYIGDLKHLGDVNETELTLLEEAIAYHQRRVDREA